MPTAPARLGKNHEFTVCTGWKHNLDIKAGVNSRPAVLDIMQHPPSRNRDASDEQTQVS